MTRVDGAALTDGGVDLRGGSIGVGGRVRSDRTRIRRSDNSGSSGGDRGGRRGASTGRGDDDRGRRGTPATRATGRQGETGAHGREERVEAVLARKPTEGGGEMSAKVVSPGHGAVDRGTVSIVRLGSVVDRLRRPHGAATVIKGVDGPMSGVSLHGGEAGAGEGGGGAGHGGRDLEWETG
jgi:hypothetical protein